jgi:hypothetical protein
VNPVNVIRGQQVIFPRLASGLLDTNSFQSLLRAEDMAVPYWQVTLSPVYRSGVGSTIDGIPARGIPPTVATGDPVLRMTWGGGGVSFRTDIPYPSLGASFAVAGDNIMLDVRPRDGVTVFPVVDVPAVNAWVAKRAAPTSHAPLLITDIISAPFAGPFAVNPFARALVIYTDTAGATITVTFTGPTGAIVSSTTALLEPTRVPIPTSAVRYTVAVDIGLVSVAEELVFT